jgi:hypothetical protein
MSEGTSLEDIETGNVAYSADTAVMNAILSDMNAVEEAHAPPPQMPQYQPEPLAQMPPPPPIFTQMQEPVYMQPHMPQMPQMQAQHQHYQEPNMSMYEPVEEPQAPTQLPPSPLKRNAWSQIFDDIREPLIVGLLVTVFSLPALHTWLSKRLTWAYKVGGSLSWIGFFLQFALVAGIFATYRQIMRVMELTA